jgi:CRISPR-associated endonuclease/helicase Cas3
MREIEKWMEKAEKDLKTDLRFDEMEMKQIFKDIVGFYPYDFQLKSIEVLSKGKSLILMAPTGSGKTEIPIISFLLKKNETLPSQMIYSLPTRTLIENLSERIHKYSYSKGVSTAFHHGKRIESKFFSEDIIVTTIDQTVGAYVCMPLSSSIKNGNIFAGSVSSALLVFDEVHTFDPKRGLQTFITIVEHSNKLKLPFVIMSATLPDLLIKKIKNIGEEEAEIIEVENENEIKSRKERRVILHTKPLIENKKISVEEILGIYNSSKDKKLIIICNTVDKAQQIYEQLKNNKNIDASILLIHSRFLDQDRKEKENLLQKLFSRESKEHVILISTQVIEVGMDISSDTIISELAPIDSLIQRAGRCARWGGNGEFYVFDIEDYGPYREKEYQQIINNTKEELKKLNNEILSWDLERKLVNKILSNYYKEVLDESRRAEIIGTLFRALFERDKSKVEECVRDAYTCYVSIHDNPQSLCNDKNDILRLQKINVNVFVFRSEARKLLENGVKIWSVEESNILDDYTFKFTPVVISYHSDILPFKHYIVSPEGAYYDSDVGLILGNEGSTNFTLLENESIENKEKEFIRVYDPWVNHAKETLRILDTYFIPKYSFVIRKFSEFFGMSEKDLVEKIRIAVALHDLGKLNKYWQEKIGWDGKIPLAHNDKVDVTRVGIPHATVSAKALSGLYNEWGEVSIPLLLAIAHHHSPYSQEYKPYKFINNWEAIIEALPLHVNFKNIVDKSKISDKLEFSIPYLGYENNIVPYRFYAFVSKILRLSDWIATGGEKQWSIM